LSIKTSTLSTIPPALRTGGSSTLITSFCGLILAIPKLSNAMVSIGFFFAYERKEKGRGKKEAEKTRKLETRSTEKRKSTNLHNIR
jgi:flagellar biosynthesis component FlhA